MIHFIVSICWRLLEVLASWRSPPSQQGGTSKSPGLPWCSCACSFIRSNWWSSKGRYTFWRIRWSCEVIYFNCLMKGCTQKVSCSTDFGIVFQCFFCAPVLRSEKTDSHETAVNPNGFFMNFKDARGKGFDRILHFKARFVLSVAASVL